MFKKISDNQQTSEFDINQDTELTHSLSLTKSADDKHIKKRCLFSKHIAFVEKTNQQKIIQLCLSIIGFLFLFLCLIRVPYFGVFFDNVFFSFFSGWTKYLVYFFLFSWIIISFFKKPYYTFFRLKYIILYFGISFLIALILSSIGAYVLHWQSSNFSEIFWNKDNAYITNWYEQLWVRDLYEYKSQHLSYASIIMPNKVGYGGLIANVVVACFIWGSPTLIIIFSLLLIIGLIIYFIFKETLKSWFSKLAVKIDNKFRFVNNKGLNDHKTDTITTNIEDENSISNSYTNYLLDTNSYSNLIDNQTNKNLNNDRLLENGVHDQQRTIIDLNQQNDVLKNPELIENALVRSSLPLVDDEAKFSEITKETHSRIGYLDFLMQKINPRLSPIISEINQESFDSYNEYQSFANLMIDKLEKYFRTQGYDFCFYKKEIEYQTANLIFKIKSEDRLTVLREIIDNTQKISDWLDGTNLKVKALDQETILFVVRFKQIACISLKDVLNDIGYHTCYTLGLGKLMNRDAFILDTIEKPNQLVYGNKAPSGRIMQISQMVLSAAFLNIYRFWEFHLFDTTKSFATSLKNLKHVVSYETGNLQILQKLKCLKNDIEVEKQLLSAAKANNIYEYNSLVEANKIIPNRFIVINDVVQLYKENAIIFHQLLSYFLVNAKDHGLNVLISSEKILDELNQFYDYINTIICFNLNTPNESVLAINSLDATYLNSYGDAIALINHELIHFQAPYGPKNVVTKMIDLINDKQSYF